MILQLVWCCVIDRDHSSSVQESYYEKSILFLNVIVYFLNITMFVYNWILFRICLKVHPAQPSDVKNTIATATNPGGQIDKYLIGADIRLAPVSLTLAKFLNEEADGALSAAQIVETTSKLILISYICRMKLLPSNNNANNNVS